MGPFDRAVFLRTLALSLVNVALAAGVVALTDELYATSAARVARLSAMAPGLAALGALLVLAHHRARGELAALAALGAPPWRTGLGAMLAGWLVGACAILVLWSPLSDASALFPMVSFDVEWLVTEVGFLEVSRGVRVEPDGTLELVAPSARAVVGQVSPHGAALYAIAPLAVLCPLWAASPLGLARRLLGAAIAVLATIWGLHAVAAGRLDPGWLLLMGAPLWVEAALGHVLSRTA